MSFSEPIEPCDFKKNRLPAVTVGLFQTPPPQTLSVVREPFSNLTQNIAIISLDLQKGEPVQ